METLEQNLVKKLGAENLRKIQAVHIGLAGAGGLGSNCAMNLTRAGFRKFTIVDFDEIVPSNLDRQFFFADQIGLKKVEALKINLLRINPDLDIKTISEKIDSHNALRFFSDCNIVAECLDKAEYKSMLVAQLSGSGKFIVGVSGLGGVGASDEIKVHIINDNLIIIGDLRTDISQKPAISPRVNITAAKQADEILNHVIKNS